MTCPPNPLGFFALDLLRQDWPGRQAAFSGSACRLQGRTGARVASPQSSIFRHSTSNVRRVDSDVNYAIELGFIPAWRLVIQGTVQTLGIVINLDVFEDLTPRLGLRLAKTWFSGKHSVFSVLKKASAWALS